ncbi:MAG: ABC transporter substrate-binding protein [Tannerella sp.]|jgi:iron complex transport system substrate-binding protein|nr:ABC transporter substrate-binding protein [Tannerella sp.]
MNNFFLAILLFLFLTGCHSKQVSPLEAADKKEYTLYYAEGFRVDCYADYTVVDVRDPWNPQRNLQRYILIDREKDIPENLPEGTLIRIPIRRIAVTTAVHSAALDELGVLDDVIGVCEPRFINSPAVRARVSEGTMADLGESVSPNTEKIIALGVEVLIASPFQHAGYGAVEKTGIPIIECADYMETQPLGRAEWLRFLGLLTGKTDLADSLFRATENRYMDIKRSVANVTTRPTLLTEKRYGSTWYVPSGQSYMAHLYHDAGADYLFADLPGAGGTPLNFETVYNKAVHADFWLFNYFNNTELTYSALAAEYAQYANFDAFKRRRIFACNTGSSLFYEQAPMHPDYLLRDLVAIFHPDLMPDNQHIYYFPLK